MYGWADISKIDMRVQLTFDEINHQALYHLSRSMKKPGLRNNVMFLSKIPIETGLLVQVPIKCMFFAINTFQNNTIIRSSTD